MKQQVLKTLVTLMLLSGAISVAFAGTYASGLRATNLDSTQAFDGSFADGTGAKLWFTLNGHADTVKVWVVSNNVRIKAFNPLLNLTPGRHNVLWDGKDDGANPVMLGHYSFEVFTSDTGNSTGSWAQSWQNPVYLGDGIGLSSRDIDVVQDPMSPYFGSLVLTEATTFYGYARMLLAHANGDLMTEYGKSFFPQGTGNVDPWFLSIGRNGNQYVSSSTLNSIFVFRDTVLMHTIKDEANIPAPRGITAVGEGEPTLLIATGKAVVKRWLNGSVDTIFATAESLGYAQDVAMDDSGYVYISFGASATTYTKVVRLSPAYAAIDTVTLPDYATYVNIAHGANRTSNADDIVYARARGTNGGVFKLDFAGKAVTKLFTPSTSTSAYHSIALDMFGNIYYANPSAEWVRMYVAPNSAPMKWTTHGGSLNILPAASKIIDGFDAGMGHFGSHPTFSGSTAGIDPTSTSKWNQMQKISGFGGAMEINLIDNAGSTAAWGVRFLSGVGNPGSNDSVAPMGYIGYWLKTSTAPKGAMVGIGMDDPSDPVTKRSIQQPVINDGEWHLYQWNIADSTQWTPWVVTSGSPKIKGPRVNIDAVWFFAPDSSAPWTIHMDNVSYNPNGPLGNEPGRGDVTDNGLATAFDAAWVLQHVVKMRPFHPHQVLAGDVNLSHNGSAVNAYDASIILANVVGKIPYLPWKQPLPPMINTNGSSDAPVSISIGSVSGQSGKIVSIPVMVPSELSGLRSAEMVVQFNTSDLKIRGVSTTDLTKNFTIASNIVDGTLSIAMANSDGLEVGGTIVYIEAEILRSRDQIALTVDQVLLNDQKTSKVTSVGGSGLEVPQTFQLSQNYPNPFNPSTTIEFQLPSNEFVELNIYDISGREVTTLVSETMNAGTHRFRWNATDQQGLKVASGVYFYRISAGSFTQIKKMLLMK